MHNQLKYHQIDAVSWQCITNNQALADIYYLSPHKEKLDSNLCYLLIFHPSQECIFIDQWHLATQIIENAWQLLNLNAQNS